MALEGNKTKARSIESRALRENAKGSMSLVGLTTRRKL